MKTQQFILFTALLCITSPTLAVDIWLDVDTALPEVPVNILPLTDDTDFKSRKESVAYDAPGIELIWHFTTTSGATTATVVTPTTGGNYDWAHQDGGMYTIEIPASGGVSINNDTEGFGWFTGVATGVLPWRGPVIGFRSAAMNNVVIDGGTLQSNLEDMYDGTGYAGGTAKLTVDAVKISGSSTAADNAEIVFDTDFATAYDTTTNMWNVDLEYIGGASYSGALIDATDMQTIVETGITAAVGVAGASLTDVPWNSGMGETVMPDSPTYGTYEWYWWMAAQSF